MQVINSSTGSNIFNCSTGIGLGNFDGLHIGHMALINTLLREARRNGLT